MLAIRISEALEKRLNRLAKRTGRTKTFYAREAIEQHIEALEDIYLAEKRLNNPSKRWPQEQLEQDFDLED